MTRLDEMTADEKAKDDELGRIWAEAVKARLVSRAKGLAPAATGITEPPWVTRAQARIDHIYEVNNNEITFAVVDQIVAEEKAADLTIPANDDDLVSKAEREAAPGEWPMIITASAVVPSPNGTVTPTPKKEKKPRAERKVDDNYPTPFFAIARFLDTEEAGDLPGGPWLEPTAGAGAIIKAVNSYFTGIDFHAIELREEHEEALSTSGATSYEIGDFLTLAPMLAAEKLSTWEAGVVAEKRFTVGIGNPPFNKAFEIIQAMWPLCDHIVLLLRVNFLAGEKRAEWMRVHTPDVYVLPNRPSFAHDGGTDMTEYCWAWWDTSRPARTPGKVVILASTPKADRK